MDVLVVGGGLMGLSTAWAAAKRGASVTLVDPRPLLNEHNASNDESKVFRLAYARDRAYVHLAKRALLGWRELEKASGRTLLHQTGLAMFGPLGGFGDQSARTLLEMGEPVEVVEGARATERFPCFAHVSHVVIDPQGGWLDPPACLAALEAEAQRHGARIVRGPGVTALHGNLATLSDGSTIEARRIVVTAGFHAPRLLPHLRPRIRVTRQPELMFAAPAEAHEVPVFAAFEEGFYGFPLRDGAYKIADHRKGPIVTDVERRPPVSAQEEAIARGWLRMRMPWLAAQPLARSRVCLYDNTHDDHFLVGPVPGAPEVIAGAGFSGHGFKFGPAVGEELARLAL